MAKRIDVEVRSLIDRCYGVAKQILIDNDDKLHAMAEALMKYETIDADQIRDIMAGRDPRPPAGWDDDTHARPGGGATADDGKDVSGEAPIGGPAGQH